MRKTLYYTFILAYVLVFICTFLIIDLWTSDKDNKTLYKQKARDLYDTANVIVDAYIKDNFYTLKNDSDLQSRILAQSRATDADFQLIDYTGNVIYRTDNHSESPLHVFDITDFGNSYYTIDKFYDMYDTDMLTVVVPITNDFSVDGYLFMHYDISNLSDVHLDIMNTTYITFFLMFLLTLIILFVFTSTVFIPLKKISAAAREYAKGNFTYEGLKHFTEDTEIGRLGVSLNFMAHELNTMKTDERKFIANISHDFRSPLTSIKGYIEAMKDGTIPPQMQNKYLDIVLFETDRLTKLTENLLTLNRWDDRGNHLNRTNFNIYPLIRQNLASLEGKCAKKNINFMLKTESKYYMVYADKNKISQVIYNLTDNALKFSHNDSTITVSLSAKGEKVFVSVKDNGIGIPKDLQNKIWDRFYKTDLSRGKDKTGSGLGLAIAKEIIQAHDENINVISTEGVGTEFIFTLQKSKGM